uniref:U3 small nucleolar RNA-associated protein 11 n=1 Tax=Aplanochytrium stocchinoi TaxID=215587 RepID=A0A7S3LL89_9STRA|mmetsp:Transcript_81/g.67  ORF Transcript_81/g.67 Transcript_81/m.67 type:complete len:245 (+) Transcript_81:111-845(+)
MSSLRNAVKRKTHKERGQPSFRKRLGHLEKHKDYVLRAQDYHKKKRKIQQLRLKALFRNPDEFYHGMVNTKLKDGKHILEREKGTFDEIKLIRTQNLAYLNNIRAKDKSKTEKLKASLHLIGEKPINTHTIFLDNDAEASNFDKAEHFDTVEELADRTYNRVKKSQLSEENYFTNPFAVQRAMKQRKHAYTELSQRLKRQKSLGTVVTHIQLHKNLEQKGKRIKVKDGEDGKPPVYRWKRERKR